MQSILSIRLKECRKEKNLTQQELSDLIYEEFEEKVPRTSIARYESGTREPDNSTLSILAAILNVDTDYLLGITETKHQDMASEQIQCFVEYLNDIVYEDDEKTNDLLWNILSDTEELIRTGRKHGSLNQISYLINLLGGALRQYYNSPLDNSLEELVFQLKKVLHLSWKKSNRKHIEYIVDLFKKDNYNPLVPLEEDDIFSSIFNTYELQLLSYYDNPYTDESEIPDYVKSLIKVLKTKHEEDLD